MSIASLKEELLRELAVEALAGSFRGELRGGTDLFDYWSTVEPLLFQKAWVFRNRGPSLIVKHVAHGSRVWFTLGSLPTHVAAVGGVPHGERRHVSTNVAGAREIVVTETVYQLDDLAGVTRIHVRDDAGNLYAICAFDGAVDRFLENVLVGHVQDA